MVAVRRKPVPQQLQPEALPKYFPAPVRGWIANENIAASKPGGALVLENWFPTQTGIRLRGGSPRKATVSTVIVESLLSYASGNTKKLFAASDGKIFNITAPADTHIAPAPDVTGRTSNYYSFVQFATVGGDFMIAVNGTDLHLVYDGTSWAVNSPAITGVSSALLSQVWVFKNRLFFVQKETKKAWYLPVDSIGGAALEFSLEGVFQKGGALLFGATWSLDAGDGLDDKCAFYSTNGEVVIFQGTDPSSSTTWAQVGRYDMSPPLGIRGHIKAGGDLVVAAVDGFTPVSMAVEKDPAILSSAAVSKNIEPEWKKETQTRRTRPWEAVKWIERNMSIISMPGASTLVGVNSVWGEMVWGEFVWGEGEAQQLVDPPIAFVVNTNTGAWAKYVGWDVQSLIVHDEQAYFGTSDGRVLACELGGSDDGTPYYCNYAGLWERMGSGDAVKHLLQIRAQFTHSADFTVRVGVSTNYVLKFAPAPDAATTADGAGWDVGTWDGTAVWDSTVRDKVKAEWKSVGRTGYAVSPMVQVTCGSVQTPDAELGLTTLTYWNGGVVV